MTQLNGCYNSGSFLQRKRRFLTSSDGLPSDKVNSVALSADGVLYAGTDSGLFVFDGEKFNAAFNGAIGEKVYNLVNLEDGITAVCAGDSLFYIQEGKLIFKGKFDGNVIDVSVVGDRCWILTDEKINCVSSDFSEKILCRYLEGGKGICLAVSEKDIYIATETNISLIHGKRMEWKNILPQFSDMPDKQVKALSFDDVGYLWVGSEDGVSVFDNSSLWLTSDVINTLPKNAAYKIVTDKVGGRYFASDAGVICQNKGAIKYLSAERWVPDNKINDIAVSDDGNIIYAATDKGISEITCYYTTLIEKANAFEEIMEKYHIRRGFTATRTLADYDMEDGRVDISDNDGLWTASYVAAESFRYAATGEKEALEKARRGMKSMLFLTRITGIPGFTARAVRYPGEWRYGDGDKEWALSPDGECEWKGETSSDEMTGHFFGFSVYYDLCADEGEKEEIRKALCGIMDHIISNDYCLIDRDGLPTTWACWDPEMLNHYDKWFVERGINSFELLAFLKVCDHISDDDKYGKLYKKFVSVYHYPLNTMQHKIRDAHICHIDDNLGFLAALTLLRLEENEALRSLYLCGMEDHWNYERVERQPMFCFIHAAFTGRDSDLVEGVQSLREMPLDMIHYGMENSKRKDLVYDTEQEEWHEEAQIIAPLAYDERNIHRPDGGGFELDRKYRHHVQEPTPFLLPYWIGRYYGLIKEAE